MNALVAYSIDDNNFVLSPERVLFWEQQKTLIIADMHMGKTGHFRKSGIAVPQNVFKEDLHRLLTQVFSFKAEKLIIVGDLSHSRSNKELDLFSKWRQDMALLKIQLVMGNHDILQEQWYKEVNILVSKKKLTIGKFDFVHDIEGHKSLPGHYTFSGHLHPGITMKGRGRQVLQFPCFYFANNYCILPAFSKFTGTVAVEAKKGENVFAIVENQLLQVQ